jgi:hypothetical protein
MRGRRFEVTLGVAACEHNKSSLPSRRASELAVLLPARQTAAEPVTWSRA